MYFPKSIKLQKVRQKCSNKIGVTNNIVAIVNTILDMFYVDHFHLYEDNQNRIINNVNMNFSYEIELMYSITSL